MARIVLNTFGSFGDLHPFLALALALKDRGHQASVATAEVYRQKILDAGVRFAPVRPDLGSLLGRPDLIERLWDPKRGTEYLLKDIVVPALEGSYEDLTIAVRDADADLILTHTAGLAGPVVADEQKLRWLSVALQPAAFLSQYDQPVLAPVPWLPKLKKLGNWPFRFVRALGKQQVRRWLRPLAELRRKLGLRPVENSLFEGQFSPYGTLALFSRHFAMPQIDWPQCVALSGFLFYDQRGSVPGANTSPEQDWSALLRFLDGGPPPIVFTLGSSAVMQAGSFYEESAAAAQILGQRAVLLTGSTAQTSDTKLPGSIFATSYAPYSQLLPRACATVHQGGIGTTAQGLRAGKPMLVVPWSHDQPDNAARVCRLGAGRMLLRSQYRAQRVAQELQLLFDQQDYAAATARIGKQIAEENSTAAACDAVEKAINIRSGR